MSRKFPNGVDLLKIGQLLGARLENLASAPSNPGLGQGYWDTVRLGPLYWNGSAWTLKATDSDLLEGQNSAYHRARANHTGTQTAATISNFDTQVRTSRLDQMTAPTAAVSFNSQKITNLANGTNPADAVNVSQLEAVKQDRIVKAPVEATMTTNVTVANPGTATFDGQTLVNGERLLLTGQTTATENGIYVFNGSSSALTRASDADTFQEIDGGAEVFAQGGANKGVWRQNAELTTFDGQDWQLAQTGTTYTAGDGLTESPAATFNVGEGTGIVVNGNDVAIDPSVVMRGATGLIGDGATSTPTFSHNLSSSATLVSVFKVSDGAEWEPDKLRTDNNTVTLDFGAYTPATDEFRVVVAAIG